MKRFFSYYRPYKGLFIADVSCAAAVAVVALLIPLCVRHITKDVLEAGVPGAAKSILLTGGAMLALILIRSACAFVMDAKGHVMGAMMESDMRNELFAHYLKMPFGFYDRQSTGRLMSRLTNDLLNLTELYHHGPEDLAVNTIKLVGGAVILLVVDWKLALTVFAFLPPMAVLSRYFVGRLKGIFRVNRERIADVNARVEDSLSGIRVVKSFTNETLENERFSTENRRFLESRKDIYTNEAYYSVSMDGLVMLITATVVVLGGLFILGGTMDIADLLTFIMYVSYLTEPIPRLGQIVTRFQEGLVSFDRFLEIMNLEPDIKDAPGAADIGRAKGDVSFSGVGFRYGADLEYVLKDVSFKVGAGETVALVGTSGVGKTTLCSLIPRFYDATEGSVLLDGADVRGIALDALRRNVGVVQQDVYLFDGTVMENILYGMPGASRDEAVEAAKAANAHDFIATLPKGYDTNIGQRGVRLSGGQKQRLSIARVFLKNPPVLVFDEATSALDHESEKAVMESLETLKRNRTIFVIAHRLSTVRNAGRIMVLTDKGISEQGTHEELLERKGAYARMVAAYFDAQTAM